MFAGEMGYPQSAFFVDKPKVDGGLGSTAILRERCVSGIDLACSSLGKAGRIDMKNWRN
ncbi:MAG: hypothetical protein JRI96_07320 [Deltaproteobacteria bacterium]|nr:hypothetical protein [Deltaproteobacteria bacterium]